MRKYICEGLASYLAQEQTPWHMPGHKRKNYIDDLSDEADIDMAAFSASSKSVDDAKEWYDYIETVLQLVASMDVTELPGTDDLHHPEEMILKSQQELAKVYGTHSSYYMVNGSTGGILSAIGAVARATDNVSDSRKSCGKKSIIIARNCHKSVYNACELFGLEPIYAQPRYLELEYENSYIFGDIKPQQIKELVESNSNVAAVVITSPTYEGVVSDVAGIKTVLQPYNIPLIVDEAHGAHLPFIKELPASAISLGADIVVQSLHKTLPSMTQTAILHVNNPELNEAVKKYLSVFMSSSPSYVMLCSMELAVAQAQEIKNRDAGFNEYLNSLKGFRENMASLKNIKLLGERKSSEEGEYFGYDDTRIVLCSKVAGETLAKRLKEQANIEVEMSGTNYVVLISTYVDDSWDFQQLEKALMKLDEELDQEENLVQEENAFSREELYRLVGTVATNNVYVYPPGSYIVAAGEEITAAAVDKIFELKTSGKRIVGLRGE